VTTRPRRFRMPLLLLGVLLVLDRDAWSYFGLAGGAVYAYFGARGILSRLEMQRRSFRIGDHQSVRVAYAFLTVWGLTGLITIAAAVIALEGG